MCNFSYLHHHPYIVVIIMYDTVRYIHTYIIIHSCNESLQEEVEEEEEERYYQIDFLPIPEDNAPV